MLFSCPQGDVGRSDYRATPRVAPRFEWSSRGSIFHTESVVQGTFSWVLADSSPPAAAQRRCQMCSIIVAPAVTWLGRMW
jgi:hypothetical protein